jgi:cyclohexyl-isocyanide hydratase
MAASPIPEEDHAMAATLEIGFLLFPRLTQLDLTGPFEVLSRLPGARVRLLWKALEPVRSDTGLGLLPDTRLADCPQLDLVCVPGGPGVAALMEDREVLEFLRRQAAAARYVTSVCTGALVLGAAGLLRGRQATTHWASHDFLAALGARPVAARVVRDGTLVTGGGVTAGIDFALEIVAEIAGPAAAQAIQLQIEYAPAPPFDAGTPERAPAEVLAAARQRGAGMRAEREALVARVAARLAATARSAEGAGA